MALFVPAAAGAQSREDRHVTAISAHVLLHASPVALVDPVRQRRARAIADYQDGLFIGWAGAPILAFLWLWTSGNAARLRDLLRRAFRAPWLQRGAFGVALGSLATVASLPFAFASYRVSLNVGLTAQTIPSWFAGELLRLVTVSLWTALLVIVILGLVDRTRLWYLVFIGILYATALTVVAIEPVLFSPLTSNEQPAPAAIVAQGDAVARALGTSPVPLMITGTSRRSTAAVARTSGLGPFARIIIGAEGLQSMTPGERQFMLARQYAHLAAHDVLWLTLAGTTLFVFAAALAVLISDRIGFRRDDDPLARLPLVGTFLGVAVLLLYPAYNALERGGEARADRLALTVAAPESGVRFLVRRADDDLVALCGRRTIRWYFESRPPLGSRIAAMAHTTDPCPR
ncbi:MAG TPA: M48 family metalloprotease [Candidatus Lustribacter sp.]|nr:M48 family metalloprotease [Candidatus Lustribacter sp.]